MRKEPRNIILADRQDISRAGLMYVIEYNCPDTTGCQYVEDKASLLAALRANPRSVVIIDYTLFDIGDEAELLIMAERYCESSWLLFSTDLSLNFVKRILGSNQRIGVLLKESSMSEIREAIAYTIGSGRYVCQRVTEMLLLPEEKKDESARLTKTELEILKDIALGMTTREIAEKRISSFHTVNTHRKNIFRKIGVNNVHEATKYALRAGLVDSAEYYI